MDTVGIREMFDDIAPTYDRVNTILSFGLHKRWEESLVRDLPTPSTSLDPQAPTSACLDLCSGTGALVPHLSHLFSRVVAADISPKMLAVGKRRWMSVLNCEWVLADAHSLPMNDRSFDCVTIAYGIRNVVNRGQGLAEVLRVLKPGGTVGILEFGQPATSLWRRMFGVYQTTIMPAIGGIVSGNRAAYTYLPESSAHFPCGEAFAEELSAAGFESVAWTPLCGGIAYIYYARRPTQH